LFGVGKKGPPHTTSNNGEESGGGPNRVRCWGGGENQTLYGHKKPGNVDATSLQRASTQRRKPL